MERKLVNVFVISSIFLVSVLSSSSSLQNKYQATDWSQDSRGFDIPILPIESSSDVEKTGTAADIGISSLISTGLALLALALWISAVVYYLNHVSSSSNSNRRKQLLPGKEGVGPEGEYGSSGQPFLTDILDYVSEANLSKLVSSVRPPGVSRIDSSSDDSFNSLVSSGVGSLSVVSAGLELMPHILSGAKELMSGSVERVSEVVLDTSVQDCLLQTVCYISAPDSNSLHGRFLRERIVEGRGRKGRGGKKHNKRRKHNRDDYDDYDDDAELSSEDCEVFECRVVSVGHTLYKLYTNINNIRNRDTAN